MTIDAAARKRRLHFRAWHRGTKEADIMIGGFIDSRLATLSDSDMAWLERFLEENDVDIMAWILGQRPCPPDYDGPLMAAMRKLDYLDIPR